jgi:hypothetical protein
MHNHAGNLLGSPRAESDRLFDSAFIETPDFRALVETEDFHIVVGRRGTGKSALYRRVAEHFSRQSKVCLHAETPTEHAALALQADLAARGCSYRSGRALTRVLWRAYILATIAFCLSKRTKMRDLDSRSRLELALASAHFSAEGGAYAYFNRILTTHREANPLMLPD